METQTQINIKQLQSLLGSTEFAGSISDNSDDYFTGEIFGQEVIFNGEQFQVSFEYIVENNEDMDTAIEEFELYDSEGDTVDFDIYEKQELTKYIRINF